MEKLKTRVWRVCGKAKDLTLRKFESPQHEESWQKFEIVLMYRSNFSMISKTLMVFLYMMTGQMNFQQSKKFQDEGKIPNNDFA